MRGDAYEPGNALPSYFFRCMIFFLLSLPWGTRAAVFICSNGVGCSCTSLVTRGARPHTRVLYFRGSLQGNDVACARRRDSAPVSGRVGVAAEREVKSEISMLGSVGSPKYPPPPSRIPCARRWESGLPHMATVTWWMRLCLSFVRAGFRRKERSAIAAGRLAIALRQHHLGDV